MTASDFLVNISTILFIMAIGAALETWVPMFLAEQDHPMRRRANLGLTAFGFLVNWVLASTAAIAPLSQRPAGLFASLGWPAWIEIGLGILILDFSVGYLSHRTMHMWPPMWRFHQVHHSDLFVDVTTTYRTHPVETAWRFTFAILPVWLFGIPSTAVVTQRLLQATNGILGHANIRLWPRLDRLLSLVVVTPTVHKLHHSQEVAETNSNYANLTTLYDRVFGTYTPVDRAETLVYGLGHGDPLAKAPLSGLLARPFGAVAHARLSDRKVRMSAETGQ